MLRTRIRPPTNAGVAGSTARRLLTWTGPSVSVPCAPWLNPAILTPARGDCQGLRLDVYNHSQTTEHVSRATGGENMKRVKTCAAALGGMAMVLSAAAAADDAVGGLSRERLQRLDDHFHAYVDAGEIAGV